MLKKIRITGFRGINELELLAPTRFNLLVGPNNSGKTSLLEAIFVCCAPLNMHVLLSLISFRNGGFVGNQRYIFDQLRWFFPAFSHSGKLEFKIESKWKSSNREIEALINDYELTNEEMTQIVGKNDNEGMSLSSASSSSSVSVSIIPNEYELVSRSPKIKGIGIGEVILKFKSDTQNLISQGFEFTSSDSLTILAPKIQTDIKGKFESAHQHRRPDSGVKEWTKSVKTGHHKRCLRLIKLIDEDIENISILQPEGAPSELYAEHKRFGTIPISILGDGIRRMILLSLSLAQCANGIMCIDEFESAIHITALKRFMTWFLEAAKDMKVQVFASTHSLECVDAVLESAKGNLKDLSLYKTMRKDDSIKCKKISGKMLDDLRSELGQDVRW